ncbi:hypothetical protein VLK31_19250 [Variovorax sp. H27-G14]|uniref:hypothetical protein n=1 Tax=Variovorax sp. H27-G14 TaxID=3111914 RepID=UPI0038FC01ED
MLLGNANRANDKNMRDKTYELLKGLINTETGRNKFGWMTNAVAMLAGSVADGASGLIGAAADTLAGAHKAGLMKQVAGKHLIQMSTRLAVLKTVAAVSGVAGGALNAVMSAYSAGEAKKEGDSAAYRGYWTAQWIFTGTALTSGFAAADAATRERLIKSTDCRPER